MKNSFVKTLSVCLCLVMLLPICGCRNEETEAFWDEAKYVEENKYLSATGFLDSVCYDGIIYYCLSGYLYYAATDGSEAGPLCSKPECTHRSSMCGAHTNVILKPHLMMYNGRLYWLEGTMEGYRLVSAEPGSGERRIEQKYDSRFWLSRFNCHTTIHANTLFLCGIEANVEDGQAGEAAFIYAQDLESGEIEHIFESDMDEFGAGCIMKRNGNSIYLALILCDGVRIVELDLDTREVTEERFTDADSTYIDMTVEDDRFVFRKEFSLLSIDRATGKKTELFRGMPFCANDEAVLCYKDMTRFECYDYDHNLIGEWCFEDAGLTFPESTKYPLGCVDGKLFFLAEPDTGDDPNIGYLISCVPEENRFEVVQAIPRR